MANRTYLHTLYDFTIFRTPWPMIYILYKYNLIMGTQFMQIFYPVPR